MRNDPLCFQRAPNHTRAWGESRMTSLVDESLVYYATHRVLAPLTSHRLNDEKMAVRIGLSS